MQAYEARMRVLTSSLNAAVEVNEKRVQVADTLASIHDAVTRYTNEAVASGFGNTTEADGMDPEGPVLWPSRPPSASSFSVAASTRRRGATNSRYGGSARRARSFSSATSMSSVSSIGVSHAMDAAVDHWKAKYFGVGRAYVELAAEHEAALQQLHSQGSNTNPSYPGNPVPLECAPSVSVCCGLRLTVFWCVCSYTGGRSAGSPASPGKLCVEYSCASFSASACVPLLAWRADSITHSTCRNITLQHPRYSPMHQLPGGPIWRTHCWCQPLGAHGLHRRGLFAG